MDNIQIESGLSFLSRVGARPAVTRLDDNLFLNCLHSPEIIEITGKPGAGKTFLCTHFAASAILPKMWLGINIKGSGAGVLFIDCEKHFNIIQLRNFMKRRVKKALQSTISSRKVSNSAEDHVPEALMLNKIELENKMNSLVQECLQHFTYLFCKDSQQFVFTLLTLDQIILNNTKISLIVIDSITTFYWYERVYRFTNWIQTELFYNKVLSSFINLVKKNNLTAICTKQILFATSKNKSYSKKTLNFDRQSNCECSYNFIGKEWPNSVSYQLHIMHDLQSKQIQVTTGNTKTVIACAFHADGIEFMES